MVKIREKLTLLLSTLVTLVLLNIIIKTRLRENTTEVIWQRGPSKIRAKVETIFAKDTKWEGSVYVVPTYRRVFASLKVLALDLDEKQEKVVDSWVNEESIKSLFCCTLNVTKSFSINATLAM